MSADIRSFFGGKPAAKPPAKKEDPSNARRKRSRKVVDDSDDEEVLEIETPKPKPKPLNKPKPEEPKTEPTTSSDYFASSKRKGRSSKNSNATPVRKSQETNDGAPGNDNKSEKQRKTQKPPEVAIPTDSSTSRQPSPKKPTRERARTATVVPDEDGLGGDDIHATEFRNSGRGDDDYVEEGGSGSEAEELAVKPPNAARDNRAPVPRLDDDVYMKGAPKQTKPAKLSSVVQGRKRKSDVLEKDEVDESRKGTKAGAARSKETSPSKKRKEPAKQDKPESKEIQDIYASIPTVRAPSPPPASGEPKKFNYHAHQAQQTQSAPATGSVELPAGAENCLAGLSFVFTGILDALGREEGQSLVKRYGGKVTGSPSGRTSYVVLGHDAGPKKLGTIKAHNLKTIDEQGLFELIRRLPPNGGDGKAAEKYQAKKKAEEDKIKAMATEMDREEKAKRNATTTAISGVGTPSGMQTPPASTIDDRLWTTKYAPTSMNMICGNKGIVEKLQAWLRNWHKNARVNFSRPGKDGSGTYRAVMLHGPPGVGKTTAAHLVAKLEGYDIMETNASDTRSKKLVENGLLGVLDTTSLQGYFAGAGQKVEAERRNLALIMDEVDGMSAGDRGGVGALASVAKKTRIPLILICNDRRLPKMKPFDHVVYELPFRRPTAEQIRARLSTICFREGLKIPPQVLDSLIEGTNADIRQVINMLSTVKLDQPTLDYDKGKEMSKAWEKHIILKPWDIVGKILNAQTFSPSSKMTLNQKTELYFNDHEFSYLMLQENYLRTNPTLASSYQGRERSLKLLELADNAASSISDGDLVDKMIHGTQQQWSLMPTHAAFSFVRPASFVYGNMMERPGFTSWLGQNSKQGKLWRFLKEIQGHMCLRSTGDRDEIRQQYIPAIWDKLVRRMMEDGKESVESVIDFMDSYFLTREDWDSLVELGLGPMDESNVKLDTQTKATFTRLYNQSSHPVPFMKATDVVAPKKAPKEKPDIEDAIEESDEEEVVEEEPKDEEEELDLKKDKYVIVPKKPAAQKKGSGKGKKGKKASTADDDFVVDDEKKPARKGKGRKANA